MPETGDIVCTVALPFDACFNAYGFFTYGGIAYCDWKENLCDNGSGYIYVDLCLQQCEWNNDSDKKNGKTGIPSYFNLSQNYPNPFNPTTQIKYQIANDGFVNLKVYNELGEEVSTLIDKFQQAGFYSVEFNGENLPSGMYYYRIKTSEFNQTKKMVLIK
jgi:hypothetical protein